jgi:type III secretion protein C
MKTVLVKVVCIIGMMLLMAFTFAAEIPNINRNVTIIAREQPIDSFLKELFSQISVPVKVDESVKGKVNASFQNIPASEIYNNVSRSFGLIMYYDGAVVSVYSSNSITRRIVPVSRTISKRVVKAAKDLDLVDTKNHIKKAVDGGLVVTGTRRFIEQIDELVYAAQNNLNEYEPPVGFKVFYLKYAWAQDVTMTFDGKQVRIPGVATILRQLLDDSPQAYIGNDYQDRLISPTVPGLKGQGLNSIGRDDRIGLPDSSQGIVNIKNATQSQQQVPVAPVAVNNPGPESSKVRIQADPRLNAIIVRDSPDRMARYQQLIDSLDIEPQMLEIEATIIDINTDKMQELGMNWRWQNNSSDQVLFGSGNSTTDAALNLFEEITPSGRGGFISFVIGDNAKFIGRIRALEEEKAAKIVSRPHVLTLSNVEAIFNTNSTFHIRVAGREEVDLYNISVGTSLRVTPHVFKDNGKARIKLLVTIEDGNQTSDQIDGIPVINNSAINTQALINAGESVLIGGLVREVSDESEYKIPFLGDIPIMGHLFKETRKNKVHMERLFLISPKLEVHKMSKNASIDDFMNSGISHDIKGKDSNSNQQVKPEVKKEKETQKKNNDDTKTDDSKKESWEVVLDID